MIIPNYFDIITLTVLMMYSFAVWGCIEFGGTFKYLQNYEIPQANFNSMLDSFMTLFQLFVGEAWNSVMGGAISSLGTGALMYFMTYIIITTLLMTNLLMGVIISGYGSIVEIQKDAKKDKVETISSKLLVTALKIGKLSNPKLYFEYHPNHIEIEHRDVDDEGNVHLHGGRSSDLHEKIKMVRTDVNDFDNVMNDSEDQYGFYTSDTVELLVIYCRIALEEADYAREVGWTADQTQKKKSRRRSVSLNGIL